MKRMRRPPIDKPLAALRDAACTAAWTGDEVGELFLQARVSGLLGRLGPTAQEALKGQASWTAAAEGHVEAAARLSRAQLAEVEREAGHIANALAPLGAPVVLLKGAAYAMAQLPAAQGRVFSDIDILVPKAHIGAAENWLTLAGWRTTHLNAYDQHYYRTWMHELPPMQHQQRQTTLDVHHNILPETARLRPDATKLLAAARPLPGWAPLHVLCPTDMVLHSMTHLFMNDDMRHALRDLSDLDLLLRHFDASPGFWETLVERAVELDLCRPLYYGLTWTHATLGTPIPATARRAVQAFAPAWGLRSLMHHIWRRALHSTHPHAAPPGHGMALAALYLRGHWLRMPPGLLARHLLTKALRREKPTETADRTEAVP